jgi:hypothetical protein
MDWLWVKWAGFQIGPGGCGSLTIISVLLIVSVVYCYRRGGEWLAELTHSWAQYLSLLAVLLPLSYAAVSTNAPLLDNTFAAADLAIGLDWIGWAEWVIAHPVLRWVLRLAYASLPIQMMFNYWYNAYTRASWKNSELWWITLISGLLTISASAVLPASNPYVYYGLGRAVDFPHMQQFLGLRDGTMHVITFTDAQGLVQLPSFHTVLAIMLTHNLRHCRLLFLVALILNVTLVLSCPTEGSHYFIDLVAGAVVAAATIWAVRTGSAHFRHICSGRHGRSLRQQAAL